jgi:hypothetical protein
VHSIKKNRRFLAKSGEIGDGFSESRFARLTLPTGMAKPGLWRRVKKMTREWRRKPLKSLKTDSEMASAGSRF